MTITLTLNDKTLTIVTREIEGKELYKAQDLLRGYYKNGTQAEKQLWSWKRSIINKTPQNEVFSKTPQNGTFNKDELLEKMGVFGFKGRNGGTYLTRDNLFKLAGFISYEFECAVYKAFGLLVDGKKEEALTIAQTVASFHRENARVAYKELSSKIVHSVDEGAYSFSKYGNLISFRNFNNLLWKYSTGTPLPKPAPTNLRDELVSSGRADEAFKLDVGTQMLIGLLNAGQSYETIKLVMGVK
ncbi:TPA: hypothetical protein PMC50_002833 [Vibrio cholerae]|nr:hypothetical protein [Vibrio cholerae]